MSSPYAPDREQDPGERDPNLDARGANERDAELETQAPGTNIDEQPTGEAVDGPSDRVGTLDRDGAPDERIDEHGIDSDQTVGALDEQRARAEEKALRENNSLVNNAQGDGIPPRADEFH